MISTLSRVSTLRQRVGHWSSQRKHERSLRSIFQRHREFTMMSEANYMANLAIAERVRDVPGCVVECGVWRGGMIAGLADVLGSDRSYFLFDSFEGLPPARAIDGPAALAWQANTAGPWYFDNCRAEAAVAEQAMRRSAAKDFHLVKGWFDQTVPAFEPPAPIALLRLDADWYDSMKICLQHLHHYLARDGIVLIDDYYTWDGCTRAVHEFLLDCDRPFRIHQLEQVCFIC